MRGDAMEEERQRRILEDLIDQFLHAERKIILDALNAMIDDLGRDLRQVQQAGSLPATPAAKHELN
jgi:hypothetical protein